MKNNIILIGLNGSGKSVVGKILSEKLDIPFIESEQFTVKETDLLKSLQSRDKFVLSVGNNVLMRQENYDLLHQLGVIYYLFAYPETLAKRFIKDSTLEDIKQKFKDHNGTYENNADHIIHTEKITPTEVANTILAYYLIASE